MPEALLGAMWNAPQGPYIPEAVLEIDQSLYYWLFRTGSVGLFDLDKKERLDGWPIKRWPDELAEVEEGTLYWDGYLHDQDWGQLTLKLEPATKVWAA